MADELFENPRLAVIYDPFDPDRSDLEAYESMVDEFDARSVLDIGAFRHERSYPRVRFWPVFSSPRVVFPIRSPLAWS